MNAQSFRLERAVCTSFNAVIPPIGGQQSLCAIGFALDLVLTVWQ